MNETQNAQSTAQGSPAANAPRPEAPHRNVTSALYDVGITWAQFGIGLGKTALETSARALERTAKRLGDLQTQIKRDADKSSS